MKTNKQTSTSLLGGMSKLAGLIFSFLVVSCTDYVPFDNYDVFRDAFEDYIGGSIDPEQTWGFGDASAMQTRSSCVTDEGKEYNEYLKVAKEISNTFALNSFGSIDSEFAAHSTVPSGASNVMILNTGSSKPDNNCSNKDIYVTGNVTLDCSTMGNSNKIYILDNATLTMTNGISSATGTNIYIYKGGKLQFEKGEQLHLNDVKIYNRGVIEATNRSEFFLKSSVLYNDYEGRINCYYLNLDGSSVYNYGNLSVSGNSGSADRGVYLSSSKLYNTGTVEITYGTYMGSGCSWANAGYYKTGSWKDDASCKVYNSCQLYVVKNEVNGQEVSDGVMHVYDNVINVLHDGYIYADTFQFEGANTTVKMWSKSCVYAATALINENGAGHNFQTVEGATSACVWMGPQTYTKNEDNIVKMSGAITFAVDGDATDKLSVSGKYTFIAVNGAKKVPYTSLNINTEPKIDDCGTWVPDEDGETNEGGNIKARIIVEDLPAQDAAAVIRPDISDFDYNDAVFDVEIVGDDFKITPLACGGTMPLYIGDEQHEIHAMLGHEDTYEWCTKNHVTSPCNGKSVEPFYINRNGSTNFNDIRVFVKLGSASYDIFELTAEKGNVPAKICVGTDYVWCNEREHITSRYKYFNDWAKFGTYGNNLWYRKTLYGDDYTGEEDNTVDGSGDNENTGNSGNDGVSDGYEEVIVNKVEYNWGDTYTEYTIPVSKENYSFGAWVKVVLKETPSTSLNIDVNSGTASLNSKEYVFELTDMEVRTLSNIVLKGYFKGCEIANVYMKAKTAEEVYGTLVDYTYEHNDQNGDYRNDEFYIKGSAFESYSSSVRVTFVATWSHNMKCVIGSNVIKDCNWQNGQDGSANLQIDLKAADVSAAKQQGLKLMTQGVPSNLKIYIKSTGSSAKKR